MTETIDLAGLRCVHEGDLDGAPCVVVLAHGFEMEPVDLSPFARSLGAPAAFFFPEAPLSAPTRGRAWWPIDVARRAEAMARGPRDLASEHPAGLAAARERFAALLDEVRTLAKGRPLVVGGFSQGGMLTMETLLKTGLRPDGVVLLSTSRIAFDEWEPLGRALEGLPVLVAHGKEDADLSFAAGEALRDFLAQSGADVTWVPHDGGHQIPLPVWRALKRFVIGVTASARASS